MLAFTSARSWHRRAVAVRWFGLIAACATIGDTAAGQSAPGTWQKTAHGVIVSPSTGQAKKIRVDVMSDRIIRVTAVPTVNLNTPKSLMTVMTPESGVTFRVAQTGDRVTLTAPRARADISLTTGEVKFRDANGNTVLSGFGAGTFSPVKVEGQDFYAIHQEFNRGTDEGFYGMTV